MIRIITWLVAKKVRINGQVFLQSPRSGWRKKIFERLTKISFENRHRNIQSFPIEQLEKVLSEAENLFKEKNHVFQIDIYNINSVELQIIHPIMITDKVQREHFQQFGFMLYQTFDSTIEGNAERHKKFRQLEGYSEYIHFNHDDVVDCYGLECCLDKKKAVKYSSKILTEVLGYQTDSKYYFSISDNGRIEETMPNTM